MSFGQQSGPPASAKQVAYLSSLLQQAGYDDFRTARYMYGLTQRQAAGKFSTKEAAELIDRLLGNEPLEPVETVAPIGSGKAAVTGSDVEADPRSEILRGIPGQLLANELIRRGWLVVEPF